MRETLLFIQLPQLDNDISEEHENHYLAAAYLEMALRLSPVGPTLTIHRAPASWDTLSDEEWLEQIEALHPHYVAATAYLWNIERTLALFHHLRRRLPRTRLLLGGPEIAFPHPFALRSRAADVLAAGEGECLLPEIIQALRSKRTVDAQAVAWRTSSGYWRGRRQIREWDLTRCAPLSSWSGFVPDVHGVASLETTRGCPLHCLYCRYHHLRRTINWLSPREIGRRLRALRKAGARHVRLIDPTFNVHPAFEAVLERFARENPANTMTFFAELRAERLMPSHADALARAGFAEIEAGVQSTDPAVLQAIGRPTDLTRLAKGIRLLTDRGIRVSLDLMLGLPFQTKESVLRDLEWALQFPSSHVRIQFLHTLLLPGTDLRRRACSWGIRADPLPPYGVRETPWIREESFRELETLLADHPRLETDVPTRRFVGRTIPDLFSSRRFFSADEDLPAEPPITESREAWIIKGSNLYTKRRRLAAFIRKAVERSPHTLWQFVLAPYAEEPLDLLDALIKSLRDLPLHLNDRYPAIRLRNRLVSRRLMVQLPGKSPFSPDWITEAEETLRQVFY